MITGMIRTCVMYMRGKNDGEPGNGPPQIRLARFAPTNGIDIATLLGAHLVLVAARHHTQFRGPRKTERKVVGVPTFPGQTPRSLGLMSAVTAVLFLLGGLVQINPIWLWGPYHVASGTNGAQPDWYLGWLIGALRLVPGFDLTIGHYTLVPNPFWGGALFPLVVFGDSRNCVW